MEDELLSKHHSKFLCKLCWKISFSANFHAIASYHLKCSWEYSFAKKWHNIFLVSGRPDSSGNFCCLFGRTKREKITNSGGSRNTLGRNDVLRITGPLRNYVCHNFRPCGSLGRFLCKLCYLHSARHLLCNDRV